MASSNLCVPVKLDAFVLNLDACDGSEDDKAKISPISQPNYTYLHLKDKTLDGMLRDDVVTLADLHNAAPHERNFRVTDVGTGKPRTNRLGVYLHWMIPRPYRTGAASAHKESAPSARARGIRVHDTPQEDDHTAPRFPLVPNRWLVIRKLHTKEPSDAPIKDIESWVVDSDLMRLIDELDDNNGSDIDMQVDVSPYLATTKDSATSGGPKINRQAEVFIGKKTPAEKWVETGPTTNRVALSLMNSSNELFPDYQPHNSNVFSVVDTFEYDDGGKKKHLTAAEANYFVIGWHDNGKDDLMYLENDSMPKKISRGQRLAALNMSLFKDIPDWSNSMEDSRILCHGSMYNVEWHETWTNDTRPIIPADKVASDIKKNEPLAVGTTPLDSLLAYVTSDGSGQIEEGLKQLSALLRAQSESVEDRRAGADEVQSHNFSRHGGGSRYVLQIDPANPATPPSPDATKVLSQLNDAQLLADSIARQLQQTRWDLFSLWWEFQTNINRDEHTQEYTNRTEVLKDLYQKLADMLTNQTALVDSAKKKLNNTMNLGIKEANHQEFYQHLDPTLFVGGVKAGWPTDFLKSLKVRLDPQIQGPTASTLDSSDYTRCIPPNLQTTADLLFREFIWYETHGVAAPSLTLTETNTDTFPPLYHDGRDLWNKTQPWFPLFLEWEAKYCHVPFPNWEVDEVATDKKEFKKFRYVVEQKDQPLWDMKIDDWRTVSGRILLLPQPVFSLHADIERLFERVPAETIKKLIKMDPDVFKAAILELPYISAPLSGFIDHLLTLKSGTHLKPNVRYPGKAPEPLPESYANTGVIQLGEPEVKLMGTETNFTPYGSLTRLTHEEYPAFKPATHGQFKFTKINIIDKFGQAVCVVDPTRRGIDPDVTPYIGEYYRPQPYKDGKQGPNVVEKPASPDDCRFMQMPPSINQLARWNFEFVTLEQPKTSGPYWRPVTEWENPIWGWVVVNYVDYGVQFFLSDGTFYREIRIADVNNPKGGTIEADAWLPFKAPVDLPQTSQLNKLIKQFIQKDGQKYLMSFIKMLNSAAKDTTTTPGAYSQCVNSLIGKPFALVNAGASLELAIAAKTNQSTVGNQQGLISPYELLTEGSKGQYEFPIKLGDHAKPHDGLVGYFKALNKPEDGVDVTKLYTSFADPTDHISPIDKTTFPKIKPFRLDPTDYNTEPPEQQATDYVLNRTKKLTTFGLILDPFTPVNIYSSILPIQPLKLAQWTWETAIKNMTAFFHIGPIVLPDDVPRYDSKKQLGPSYDLTQDAQVVTDSKIELPSLAKAQWGWLQPYMTEAPPPPSTVAAGGKKPADSEEPNFMALNLGKWDSRPKFEQGPFTAIEGYLQMKKPIFTDDPKKG